MQSISFEYLRERLGAHRRYEMGSKMIQIIPRQHNELEAGAGHP
jgi:hypothetical protein